MQIRGLITLALLLYLYYFAEISRFRLFHRSFFFYVFSPKRWLYAVIYLWPGYYCECVFVSELNLLVVRLRKPSFPKNELQLEKNLLIHPHRLDFNSVFCMLIIVPKNYIDLSLLCRYTCAMQHQLQAIQAFRECVYAERTKKHSNIT